MKRNMSPSTITPVLNAAKQAIDNARVVSFDFFDTLIARLVEQPWHAFYVIEKKIADTTGRKRAFTAQRRQAESIARQRAWKNQARLEVSLEEIYAVLPEFGFSKQDCLLYRQTELEVELSLCYVEPVNKTLYDYAVAAKKKIIIVSDTYLSLAFIEQLASKCGYAQHDRIFVSSDYGESKSAEGLYAHILDALRKNGSIVNPDEILHIGDNPYGDIQQAAKWGIKTHHRPAPLERFCQSGLNDWPLLDHFPDDACPLTRSYTIGLFIRYWLESGARPLEKLSLQDVGFYVVGPLLLGFTKWMQQRCVAEKVDRLFFLARDGFIFKQAFDKVKAATNSLIESVYIYASRRAVYLASLTEMDGAANKFLVAAYRSPPPLREYFDRMGIPIEPYQDQLIRVFGSLDRLIQGFDFRLGHFFRQYVFPNMREQIEHERELATAYMKQMGMLEGPVALCDIGYAGSMQDGFTRLARLAGHVMPFKGYYFATQDKHAYGLQEMTGWLFDAVKPKENADAFYQATAIMELFFTSFHGTVLGYQREQDRIEPILRPVCNAEQQRFDVARPIQEGALGFIDMYLQSGAPSDELTPRFCLSPWKSFIANPPAVLLHLFADVKHNEGTGISSFIDILPQPPSWADILRRPNRLLQTYHQSLWQGGFRMTLSPLKRRALDCFLAHQDWTNKVTAQIDRICTYLTFNRQA